MMIFANLSAEGKTAAFLFRSWDEYRSVATDDSVTATDIIPLVIHGRTYMERKNSLRNLAIDVQAADNGGMSYGECCDLANFFDAQGRRYGLLGEFRENAII